MDLNSKPQQEWILHQQNIDFLYNFEDNLGENRHLNYKTELAHLIKYHKNKSQRKFVSQLYWNYIAVNEKLILKTNELQILKKKLIESSKILNITLDQIDEFNLILSTFKETKSMSFLLKEEAVDFRRKTVLNARVTQEPFEVIL